MEQKGCSVSHVSFFACLLTWGKQNELSFAKGDKLTILQRDEEAGWWAAELNGKKGFATHQMFFHFFADIQSHALCAGNATDGCRRSMYSSTAKVQPRKHTDTQTHMSRALQLSTPTFTHTTIQNHLHTGQTCLIHCDRDHRSAFE